MSSGAGAGDFLMVRAVRRFLKRPLGLEVEERLWLWLSRGTMVILSRVLGRHLLQDTAEVSLRGGGSGVGGW